MVGFKQLVFAACLVACTVAAPKKCKSKAIKCPITIDGRIPESMDLATFDTSASPFNPDYSKGENVSWSEILKLPKVPTSRFDKPGHKAVEVTIDDRSIFAPGGNRQWGFRRAGLLMGNGSDASNEGVQTFHWSVMQDKKANMNLTHEYMNVWHEANDYSSNQFSFNAGIMLIQDKPQEGDVDTTKLDKNLWKFLDRKNNIFWTTPIKYDGWQNFAITLDYNKNTLVVYYSEGNKPLKQVTEPWTNDNSGGGQLQFGMAKKPTETESVVFDGYQESNFFEGQIYGGVFIEDSADGCVSK